MARLRPDLRSELAQVVGWWHDLSFRSRLVNVGHLLTGNFASVLIALATAALTARALGANDYGLLALLTTYSRAVERLFGFNSGQLLITYGAAVDRSDDRSDFKALLKFGLVADVCAAVLGYGLAVVSALGAVRLFGWREDAIGLVTVYCIVMLFNVTGMPTAVMRLSGQFRSYAYGSLIAIMARLICCAVAAATGGGLWTFVIIWMATGVLGSLTFHFMAYRQLRRQGDHDLLRSSLCGITKRFAGFWSFAWASKLTLTFRAGTHDFDTLMVGALADPASAGFYHIAKRVAILADQVSWHAQAVLYPDLARLWAEGELDKMRRAVRQVEVLLGAAGVGAVVVTVLLGRPLLRWAAGEEFTAAYPLLVVLMIAVALVITGEASRSALLAMGRQQRVLRLSAVAVAMFYLTSFLLIPKIGALGGCIGHVVLGLLGASWMMVEVRRHWHVDRAREAASGLA